MIEVSYNPDVLSCLANLSNDEVFTPPGLANQILDLLPAKLFKSRDTTFLDPVCKSGVFLREIAKRLMNGLEKEIPDQQARINHIFKNQVFGIAITELTSLLSRRSVYCSKTANGKYSICEDFTDEQGNIILKPTKHEWKNGKCEFCGASQEVYDRADALETYAYQFIHTDEPEKIFKNMKFDVIIGNPPYQLSDAGDSTGASPIYHHFIEQAKKLNPRFLSMVIPARWFAGGKGLDSFRDAMLNDHKISQLVDYPIASEVFPGIKLNGGVCFFLWERDREENAACSVTTRMNGAEDTINRNLNEFDTFVRFNKAIPILKKVRQKGFSPMSEQVSRQKPFGLRTFARPTGKGKIQLYANKDIGKIEESEIPSGNEMINLWKVFTSMGYGEGGESRDYPRMIMGKPIVAPPPSACTETYLVVGAYSTETEARNLDSYLRTRFLRFLVALRKNTQHITKERFSFVPLLPMTEEWTDEKLYKKYSITGEEIEFIESLIRPMELNSEK
jgi:site-specific DNA-methyltransferase (adenine-specific)